MTLKLRATVVLCAMLLCYLDAGAQSIPINPKFGVISDEELKMAEYPQDTSAAVLILYRKIDVDATITNVMGFTRRENRCISYYLVNQADSSYTLSFLSPQCPHNEFGDIFLTSPSVSEKSSFQVRLGIYP